MKQKQCFSWAFIGLAALAVQVATIPIPLTNRVSEAASLFSAWC